MRARKSVIEGLRRQVEKEAPDCLDHLTFFAEHCGLRSEGPLSLTLEGLDQVESWYRQLAKTKGFQEEPFDRESYERLMTHFLGEVLRREFEGEWYAYVGSEYTLSPILIRFPKLKKATDVTLFCSDLVNSDVNGARQGQALRRFAERSHKNAMIRATK